MNILLLGASGQVGYELRRSLQGLGEVAAPARAQLDLADLPRLAEAVRALKPALIVNAAAYTAVERAESEPELAFRINAEAPAVLAREARALGAALVHYSTDYVFDGAKSGPYNEDDAPAPLNVYGRSKLAGEQAVAEAGIAHLILRTSWVYGMRGNNFLLTMLKRAREQGELRVVSDQFGAPTWCRTVAEISTHLLAMAAPPAAIGGAAIRAFITSLVPGRPAGMDLPRPSWRRRISIAPSNRSRPGIIPAGCGVPLIACSTVANSPAF